MILRKTGEPKTRVWRLSVLSLFVSLIAFFTGTAGPPADASEQTLSIAAKEMSKVRSDFRIFCSVCHGLDHKGGGVAKVLRTPPSDLTQIAKRANGRFHAEEVFRKIEGLDMPVAHGTSEMPV